MMTSVSCDPIVEDEHLDTMEECAEPKGSPPPPQGAEGTALEAMRLWLLQLCTLPRDLRALYRYIRLKLKIHHAQKNDFSVPKIFQEVTRKQPNKVAFYFEEETWTFLQVDEYSNRVGNYFASKGIKHGDAVALFKENSVEYVCLWLGLCKIGAVPALINYNLRDDPLMHCIKIADCKAIICGKETQDALNELKDEEICRLPHYVANASQEEIKMKDAVNLNAALATVESSTPPQLKNVGFVDKMVYIYTSGTTGMPKAAVIKHSRAAFAAIGMRTMIGVTSSDIIYDPLPLYHTAGGIIGVGQTLLQGNSTVIRRKFSVSQYWLDCAKYGCTAAQYIGEICRYLLTVPEKPEDKQHKVRLMFGNGLRPTIWEDFQKRFAIPKICEFYGSTEGNTNIINMDGKAGAVGFVSVLFPKVYPVALLKIDEETKEIVRDANGLCVKCQPGEAGEFIGKIVKNDPVRDFHGYADEKATAKKIVRDVFVKGDCAFLSGDILVMDYEGYLYFKDRTGDTFRWKGENVATSEIEGVISKFIGHGDVVVYGVEVPGAEGRAGMVAILDEDKTLDFSLLHNAVTKSLPSYARPLFVRIVKELEKTGTYKLKKVKLQEEGFNPSTIQDYLYFLDGKQKSYIPLTADLYNKIITGEVRV
ncbi:long-chain fatty acid transport protein 1-like isoform X2 [Macrobrachium rosenbergii]|uniref:long-chain fatty acid transport protein 1-like isoform X2 n=1 Tax=Macrobrachium rosenbergii TaxID=79674 RepID=UPI0034D6AC68